jgi:hypothetical protein
VVTGSFRRRHVLLDDLFDLADRDRHQVLGDHPATT